ncbi:MAG TPA: NAD(P)H-dependent oxidoreductase subunit E [Acidimicrobiia bacterium]|nr:NAD(P)H-dependent oxidoreductase subunit E [Acidimicrobiia bacterium]
MSFNDDNRRRARALIERYPNSRSAVMMLLHLAQDQDGWVSPEAIAEIAGMLDLTPAEVLGVCSFYTMYKREPVGKYVVSVCTNVTCLVRGGPELFEALGDHYADDPDVHVEEVECLAACDGAPCMQVNYDYHLNLTTETAIDTVDGYKSGARKARGVSGGAVGVASGGSA